MRGGPHITNFDRTLKTAAAEGLVLSAAESCFGRAAVRVKGLDSEVEVSSPVEVANFAEALEAKYLKDLPDEVLTDGTFGSFLPPGKPANLRGLADYLAGVL